jgi:hypothetical protein
MRINAINPWGKSLDPQRADLWMVNLDSVVDALNQDGTKATSGLNGLTQFYVTSVELPDLVITPEMIPRDSRPYNVPSFDGPIGPVHMCFIHDANEPVINGVTGSLIYNLLQAWRARVRVGRGGMSTEDVPRLDANYRPLPFQFDIFLRFLKGQHFTEDAVPDFDTEPNLVMSSGYVLKNAWLGNLKLQAASYETSAIHKIDATLYVEDIFPDQTFYVGTNSVLHDAPLIQNPGSLRSPTSRFNQPLPGDMIA